MDRRSFLMGLFGTAAAAMTPEIIEKVIAASPAETWEAFLKRWYVDAMPILAEYQSNVMIFGCGGLRHTDKYPFVESLDPFTMQIELPKNDTSFNGLRLS